MSHKVESATPLADVMVDGGQVWLRKEIATEERAAEAAGDGDGAGTRTVWVAEEVTLAVAGGITEAEARERFDELWERAETARLTAREYADRLKAKSDEDATRLGDAIEQLSKDSADSLAGLEESLAEVRALMEKVKKLLKIGG